MEQASAQPTRSATRERKLVAVLFADVAGSTELTEGSDPELVERRLSAIFRVAARAIEAHGGVLEKYIGDAVLGVFGVPTSQGDEAVRAVRAALDIQATLRSSAGDGLDRVRIGIEAGEVLVDLAHVATDRQRMVVGDAVNTAARLQALAEPGTVLVGPGARPLVDRAFTLEWLADAELKGKRGRVTVWRVSGSRRTMRSGGVELPIGDPRRLVGRRAEVARIGAALARSAREARPIVITVIGEPGVGKSGLAAEAERRDPGAAGFRWLHGPTPSTGAALFGAIAEVIRAEVGIDAGAPDEALRVEERMEDLALGTAARAAVADVLGLAPSGMDRADLLAGLSAYLEAIARAPTVLVFDDLQWADDGLLDLLEIVARTGVGPLVLLCLTRRGLLERRPTWATVADDAVTIELSGLTRRQAAALARASSPTRLPRSAVDSIVERAEGNPLFIEELARFAGAGPTAGAGAPIGSPTPDGSGEHGLPATVQAVLAARIDALAIEEKRVLTVASVAGDVFWPALIERVGGPFEGRLDSIIEALQDGRFVIRREGSAIPGQSELGFGHVLVREAAYGAVSRAERALRHEACAGWLEDAFADRLDDVLEAIAHHRASALRDRVASGDGEADLATLRGRLLEDARSAARRAASLWQLDVATSWGRTAIEQATALDRPPREVLALILGHLEVAATQETAQDVIALADRGLALCSAVPADGPAARARLSAIRANAQRELGDEIGARTTVRRALLALPPDLIAERAVLEERLGTFLWESDAVESRANLEAAIADASAAGDDRTRRVALHALAVLYSWTDQAPRAVELLEQSMELARAAGDRALIFRCYANIPSVRLAAGDDLDRSLELYREAAAAARRTADRGTEGFVEGFAGLLLVWQGQVAEGTDHLRRAIALSDSVGNRFNSVGRRYDLAYGELLLGHRRRAAAIVTEAEMMLDPEGAFDAGSSNIVEALRRWPTRPSEALMVLGARSADAGRHHPSYLDMGTLWRARMAFRLDDDATFADAADLLRRRATSAIGSVLRLRSLWIDGLGDAGPGAPERLVGVATELRRRGHELDAADACADAALLASRGGWDPGSYIALAQAGYAACRVRPPLRPLSR